MQEPLHDNSELHESKDAEAVVTSPSSRKKQDVEEENKVVQRDDRFKHKVEYIANEKYEAEKSEKSDEPKEIVYRIDKSKKILFFEMKIKRISEINTTEETFRCRFHIYLTWLASAKECLLFDNWDKNENTKHKTYEPSWKPSFSWSNAIALHETDNSEITYSIKSGWSHGSVKRKTWNLENSDFGFDPGFGRWHRVKFEYDVTFAEELELPSFPFDCQDFSLFLKVDGDKVSQCDIVPFPRKGEFCLLDPEFSVLSEWDFESLVCEFYKTDSIKSKSSKEYSLVSVRIKAARRWEAHVGHIMVTFCMFTLGLGTFAQGLQNEELGNRLSYCVTLLLADVASLQLLFDNLPNIPYWTLFDVYIYLCFGFLFSVTSWTGLCGIWEQLEEYDNYVFVFAAIVYFILQIGFGMRAVYDRRIEMTKINMTRVELDAHLKDSKTDRDRRAIAVTWNKDNLGSTDTDAYGMYVKGVRKGDAK